jgi:hypothetical protein
VAQSYQQTIELLVRGQDKLRQVTDELKAAGRELDTLKSKAKAVQFSEERAKNVLRGVGRDIPRTSTGKFAKDPNRKLRQQALRDERSAERRLRLAKAKVKLEEKETEIIIKKQKFGQKFVSVVEKQLLNQTKLNAANDLYGRRLQEFARAGGNTNTKLKQRVDQIRQAFKVSTQGGTENLQQIQAFSTELGRIVEKQRELNRLRNLKPKGFEQARRLQERIDVVEDLGGATSKQIKSARTTAADVIAAADVGNADLYARALENATAATSRLERESNKVRVGLSKAQKIRQSAILLQEKLNTLEAQGVNVTEAKSRVKKVIFDTEQNSLNLSNKSLKNLSKEISDVEDLLSLERQRLSTKNAQAKADGGGGRGRNRLGSALVGAAFPALFGGGPASILGGFVGELFGPLGGVVGSALTAPIDEFVKSTAQLGQALNPLTADFGKIIEASGAANTSFSQLITSLQEAGREGDAFRLASERLAIVVGQDGINSLREFGADTTELGNEFSKAMSQMQTAIAGIINNTGILKSLVDQIGQANLFRQGRASTDAAQQERFAEFDRLGYGGIEGGSGLDAAKRRAELEREIIEAQITLNAEKARGIELDGQSVLEQQRLTEAANNYAATFANNLEEARIRNEIAAINGGLENDVVFELEKQIIANATALELEEARSRAIANNLLLSEEIGKVLDKQTLNLANLETRRTAALTRLANRGTGGGGTGADGEKIIRDLVRQTALQKELNILAKESPEDKIGEIKLSQDRQLLQLQNSRLSTLDRIAEITDADLRAAAERLELELTAAKENAIRLDTDQKITEEKDRQKDAIEKNLLSIQNEIDLSKARLNGTEDEVRLEQQLQAIGENAGITDAKALEDLKTRLELLQQQLASEKAIQEVRDIQKRTETAGAGLRAGFIGQAGQAFEQQLQKPGVTAERATEIALLTQEMELAELQAQSLQNVVLGIGDAFATAMTTGVAELVKGTKSAEEVFADFLNNVANTLLQVAQQMIATYIAIGIARAFAGMGDGGGADPNSAAVGEVLQSGNFTTSSMADQAAAGTFKFAEGGYVSGPTRALIGEGGEPEYVIPESKMRESMARYSRGARGGSVIPENGGGGSVMDGGGGTAVAAPIDVRYTVERINSVDYVTADQFQQGLQQAASQGAKQGEQQTLKRLQMSSSTRKRLGM